MSSKLLSARQARWAETLSRYNFKISYKPGKSNKADLLTRMDEKASNQAKRDNREQALLLSKNLDSRIRSESALTLDINYWSLALLSSQEYINLIDNIFQANRTAPDLIRTRKLDADHQKGYHLQNGLLKKQGRLVVAESVRTDLISLSYCTLAIAYPGKRKTKALIKERYYWLGMDDDIERFVSNCYVCRRSKVPRDKTPGLLHLLPIPDRP
jgi:hypothetical protein